MVQDEPPALLLLLSHWVPAAYCFAVNVAPPNLSSLLCPSETAVGALPTPQSVVELSTGLVADAPDASMAPKVAVTAIPPRIVLRTCAPLEMAAAGHGRPDW